MASEASVSCSRPASSLGPLHRAVGEGRDAKARPRASLFTETRVASSAGLVLDHRQPCTVALPSPALSTAPRNCWSLRGGARRGWGARGGPGQAQPSRPLGGSDAPLRSCLAPADSSPSPGVPGRKGYGGTLGSLSAHRSASSGRKPWASTPSVRLVVTRASLMWVTFPQRPCCPSTWSPRPEHPWAPTGTHEHPRAPTGTHEHPRAPRGVCCPHPLWLRCPRTSPAGGTCVWRRGRASLAARPRVISYR